MASGGASSSGTYKDWQVREEKVKKPAKGNKMAQSANSTQKMGATSNSMGRRSSAKQSTRSIKGSKSRSKSRPREISRDSADEIRKRVQLQFNNYMQDKEALDEEISLLEDSQATPPRDIKK